jgi:hypothetical protein
MANNYQNMNRPGVATSTSTDPHLLLEDLDKTIRELEPNATPIQSLANYMGRGAVPTSNKIQVMQYHQFDNYDYCSAITLGTGADTRFANMTIDQLSRPDTNNVMYYQPQDKFYIQKTGQVVEVVVTPRASISLGDGTFWEFPNDTLTGNSTTRSSNGTVVVRNIEPYPILSFTASDIIYLGRTIYEGQPIEAESQQRSFVYDYNYVEHKEKVFQMTDDQKNWIKNRLDLPLWDWNQKQMMKEFKVEIDYSYLFDERAYDDAVAGQPKTHMRGLLHSIKTNVAYYNPDSTNDFEKMFSNFLFEQGFRYNDAGKKNKLCICGGRFLYNFNMAFKDYRHTAGVAPSQIGTTAGLNMDTYMLPGGFTVTMMRSEALRQNTNHENWAFIINPDFMKARTVLDYTSRYYQLANERVSKVMVEWQGTIAWELEQQHALLRTT